jgi:hypothetical protein
LITLVGAISGRWVGRSFPDGPLSMRLGQLVCPVIGYADDAIIVALALRSVTRRAGLPVLQRHWPGSPTGLAAVLRAAGIADPAGR